MCVFADSGVEEKLETLQGPVAVAKVVGESVLLPCVMKGYPVPVIRWTLNDRPIDERYVYQNCVFARTHEKKTPINHVGTENHTFSCQILGWMQEICTGMRSERFGGTANSLPQLHTGSSRPSSAWFGILKQTRNGSAPQSTQKESIQLLLIALLTIQRLSKFLSVKYPYYPAEVITDACVNGYYRAVRRSHVAIVSFCMCVA